MIEFSEDDFSLMTPEEIKKYYAYVLQETIKSGDWQEWLRAFAGGYTKYGFAPHHQDFWEWIYAMQPDARPKPFIGIWPRGGAKSTSVELGVVNLGARGVRNYCLYVCETQEQADTHVANIAGLIESDAIGIGYAGMGDRLLGKYGNVRGWRRNRLRTASGFTVDAIGLDTAARGIKLDENRPDLIIFDDIDEALDTPATTLKKEKIISHGLIPAGAENLAVIGIQNLIHAEGVFSHLSDGRADYLSDRIISGPIPAITEFAYDVLDGRYTITGGLPTWEGQSLARCQDMIDDMGITAFLSECQQETEPPEGGMFSHLTYMHVKPEEVPDLVKVVVWVDPAVSTNDQSDAMGIQVDGISSEGVIYRLRSFEAKSTPLNVICKALEWAVEFNASEVGIETDQGGDTWKSVYKDACRTLGIELTRFRFRDEKAGSIGPKAHRAGMMLADYEKGGRIIHVIGSHQTLERALKRFPIMKPYDLVDAAFWSWRSLRPEKRKRMHVR